jgi:hypothetical protein
MQQMIYTVPKKNIPEAMRIFKPTLFFLLISAALFFSYFQQWADAVEFNYISISRFELWRFFSSPFGSRNSYHLASNILSCVLLVCISERIKGSVSFIIDFILKVVLTNLLTYIVYITLDLVASKTGSNFVSFMLQVQNSSPNTGLQYIMLIEIFLLMSKKNLTGRYSTGRHSYSLSIKILFLFYFVLLSCLYFRYFPLVCGITIALLFDLRNISQKIIFSSIVNRIETHIRCLKFMLFLPQEESKLGTDSLNSKEESESQKSCQMNSVEENNLIDCEQKSLQSSDTNFEKSKSSRNEESVIQDFILEPTNKSMDNREPDSFIG